MIFTTLAIITACLLSASVAAFVAARLTDRRSKQESAQDLRRRTALVRAASHELRTPLNDILGFTAKLKKEIPELSPQGQKGFRELTNSSATLHKMLLDIIDIFDLPEKNIKIVSQPVNVKEVVGSVISALQKKTNSSYPEVSVSASVRDDVWVSTDVARLRQCLSALIHQSIVQTKKGNVKINVQSQSTGSGKSVLLVIKVADNSVGMDQWAADKYFVPEEYDKNPFLRGRPSSMLSLNLAKGLAEMMGGSIEVTSKMRNGVSFVFSIQTEKCDAIKPPPKPKTEPAPVAKAAAAVPDLPDDSQDDSQVVDMLEGTRILVVDDNETNLLVMETFLELFGATDIVTVLGGREALQVFEAQPFDLIFMDIQMPDLDGVETTVEIRKLNDAGAAVPIIAVSAGSRMEQEPRCKKAGVNEYLEKPLEEEALFDVITRVSPTLRKSAKESLDLTV